MCGSDPYSSSGSVGSVLAAGLLGGVDGDLELPVVVFEEDRDRRADRPHHLRPVVQFLPREGLFNAPHSCPLHRVVLEFSRR